MPKQFFFNELLKKSKIEFDDLKNYLPLQESNQKYRFFHKSVHEYFAACSTVSEAKQILSLKATEKENKAARLFQKLGNKSQGALDLPINRYLIRDLGQISFTSELIWADKQFRDDLFSIVQMSKTSDEVSTASSNAISLLNLADVPLNSLDFSGAKIPFACLQMSQCVGTDFSGADLEGVDFVKADLRGAILDNSRMKDVTFGQRADFVGHSEYVNSVAFSPDGRFIVSGSKDNTIKLWSAESGKELRQT